LNPHALRHQILNLACLPFHHPRSTTRRVTKSSADCNAEDTSLRMIWQILLRFFGSARKSNMVFDSDASYQRGGERVDNHDSVTAV
jgi:hypothetical protein